MQTVSELLEAQRRKVNGDKNKDLWADILYNSKVYGAKGDGVTDDTAAIQNALNHAFSQGGGSVWISGRSLIGSSLTIPTGCGLSGFHESFNGRFPNGGLPDLINSTAGSVLIIDPTATINFGSSSHVIGLILIRKGCKIGDADNSAFAGTALTSYNIPTATSNGGTIRNCMIFGFDRAIDTQYHIALHVENVGGDNNNGIRVNTSWDVMRIHQVHFWPYITDFPGTTLDKHHRPGVGLELVNQNDICQVDNVFLYGYQTGFKLNTAIGTGNFINCHADNTNLFVGSIGFDLEVFTNYCTFIGCSAYGLSYGLKVNAGPTENMTFTNCRFISNTSQSVEHISGTTHFDNCHFASSPNLFVIHETTSTTFINDCTFTGATTAFLNGYNNATVYEDNNNFIGTGSVGGWTTPALASADPLVLPNTGNFFVITGTTGFGTITGGWSGRRVVLRFSAALTVFDGAVVNIAGNFVADANDVLEIIHDGTQWLEIGRSAN